MAARKTLTRRLPGHTDVVHAVEADHNGTEDSSVLYIPAVPLTVHKYVRSLLLTHPVMLDHRLIHTPSSADYIRDQRIAFEQGIPPPCALPLLIAGFLFLILTDSAVTRDFPGGEGEARFIGRATLEDDVCTLEARRALGVEPYEVPAGAAPGVVAALEGARAVLQGASS